MIGNVWEWTADWWSIHPLGDDDRVSASVKQRASADEHDPQHVARRVIKGGSHLCAPNHCRRYRPAARKPQPIDISTGHIGMRCVIRPD
jgi:formylglycine-generating enzyme required for sulfatase activity